MIVLRPLAITFWIAALAAAMALPAAAAEAPPGGVRTIYLVRHGVYDQDDPRDPDVGRALTQEGEEQARLTGVRLARLGVPIDALHASSMTRARQTAAIIGKELGGIAPVLWQDIRECTPPTVREDVMASQSRGGPDSCRQRLEGAWARLFRASPGRDSVEVIVCHGNVIRYLTSRVIGLDPGLWLNLQVANCSITAVQVRADGRMRLLSLGDVGHLGPETQRPPVWRAAPAAPAATAPAR